MRVVLMSDTHLSRRAPQAQENWDAVLRTRGQRAAHRVRAGGRGGRQWAWLAQQVGDRAGDVLALVMHKPLAAVLGVKTCGLVALGLSPGSPPEQEIVMPRGVAQLTLHEDLPDPYH